MNNKGDYMKLNNKGFTLIELIGVIIIISILSLLFFPSLINQFKKTSDNMDETTEKIIIDSAKLYVDNNSANFDESKNYCLSILTLIENEYLEDNFTEYDKEDIIENRVVQIKGNGSKFNYSIVSDSSCEQTD